MTNTKQAPYNLPVTCSTAPEAKSFVKRFLVCVSFAKNEKSIENATKVTNANAINKYAKSCGGNNLPELSIFDRILLLSRQIDGSLIMENSNSVRCARIYNLANLCVIIK